MSPAPEVAPAPDAGWKPEQLDDFATLLATHLVRGNIDWLATSILGGDAARDAAGESDDTKAFARSIVKALHEAGRVADAFTLLRQEANPTSRLILGMNHILGGGRIGDDAQLQKLANRYEPFLNSKEFLERFPRISRTLCAVGLAGGVNELVGTGFLVGPDLVMTNCHVIEPFLNIPIPPDSGPIAEKIPGDQLLFFFDYLSEPAPKVPYQEGKHAYVAVRAVTDHWLVFARPMLPYDGTANVAADAGDHYDYAVIKLARAVGNLPMRASGGAPRGWLPLPDNIEVLEREKRVIVYQHPSMLPQQFDIGDFHALDLTKTRVRYKVSALGGSSGGAALDADGKLFALHNAEVDAAIDPAAQPLNQGVRIDRIAKDLAASVPHWDSFPPPEEHPFWSLSDDPDDPHPVIGRNEFRENVRTMHAKVAPPPAATPRVMVVWGPKGCGLRYSVKLLRRTLGTQARVIEYSATELAEKSPTAFLEKLVGSLGILGLSRTPMPLPNPYENLPGFYRIDLPQWLAERLDEDAKGNPSRYPVWVVLDTSVENFKFARDLDELVAALAGIHDPGQRFVEMPYLRLLFVHSSEDPLPLTEVRPYYEDLSTYDQATFATDFVDCLRRAWYAMDKEVNVGDDVAWRPVAIMAAANKQAMERRKVLSNWVREFVKAARTGQP